MFNVVKNDVAAIARLCNAHDWQLAIAESCTGGLLAAACTEWAGSSTWFERGFVSYSNAAKIAMLGVPADLIEQHGAVSEAVARAMAEGAVRHSRAHVALAVTGIAGPDGGSRNKPVGTVWFGWHVTSHTPAVTERRCFAGNRSVVRQATMQHALARLRQLLEGAP